MAASIIEKGKNVSASVIGVNYTADSAIANTVTETELTHYHIPADTLAAGDVLHFHASGQLSVADTPSLTTQLYIGGSSVLSSGALTVTGASSSPIVIDGYVVVRTIGSSGTMVCNMAISSSTEAMLFGTAADVTADSVDTTADLEFTLSFTWGTASESNTLTIANFFVEKL